MSTVSTQTQLQQAIARQDSEIIVANTIHLTQTFSINFATVLKASGAFSLAWDNPVSLSRLFTIGANGDLTLEALTIDAQSGDGSLFFVNGGKLTINEGGVIKGIVSNSSSNAVLIGELNSDVGGKLIMNGGLITDNQTFSAVMCYSGEVVMNNDAQISNNKSAAICLSDSEELTRPSLTMTGQSMIANNVAELAPGAGIILSGDVYMGIAEGDAPKVIDNSAAYYMGGWALTENSTLTMRYNAEISGNHGGRFAGGVGVALGSSMYMYDNSTVKGNTSDVESGGMYLADGKLIMEGDSSICENTAATDGGGIHIRGESILIMQGSSSVWGNNAQRGAGIFVDNLPEGASVTLGEDDSMAAVYSNTATEAGGGIYISSEGMVELKGNTVIRENTAPKGKGIYKEGLLILSQSPTIQDGLYLPTEEKLPKIVGTLTSKASLLIELSDHVRVENIPVAIADRGEDYEALLESDRAAWMIPSEFDEFVVVIKSNPDQIVIDRQRYDINYRNLNGTTHSNPTSYTTEDLPIILLDPDKRVGYAFKGWFDQQGQRVTEIPASTTGEIILYAGWRRLYLIFEPNADCVWNMPKSTPVDAEYMTIPNNIPCRCGYRFICWNTPDSATGKVFFPNDKICIDDETVKLYAQWQQC